MFISLPSDLIRIFPQRHDLLSIVPHIVHRPHFILLQTFLQRLYCVLNTSKRIQYLFRHPWIPRYLQVIRAIKSPDRPRILIRLIHFRLHNTVIPLLQSSLIISLLASIVRVWQLWHQLLILLWDYIRIAFVYIQVQLLIVVASLQEWFVTLVLVTRLVNALINRGFLRFAQERGQLRRAKQRSWTLSRQCCIATNICPNLLNDFFRLKLSWWR